MANEGIYGNLGGTAVGAGIGTAILPGMGTVIGALLGGGVGGSVGGLFGKKPKRPDISGELARITAMFDEMRKQSAVNINKESAQGRSAAASNVATRGTYSSPASDNLFKQLESDRVNSIASANANLYGQEAGLRSGLLQQLLGLDASAQDRAMQVDAARTGAVSGITSNALMALLMSGKFGGGAPAAGRTLGTGAPALGSNYLGSTTGFYPGGTYPMARYATPGMF